LDHIPTTLWGGVACPNRQPSSCSSLPHESRLFGVVLFLGRDKLWRVLVKVQQVLLGGAAPSEIVVVINHPHRCL
jgi:hypothetical protein